MMWAYGLAARGARPLAAATCWTRRRVSEAPPCRASAWVLGVVGGGEKKKQKRTLDALRPIRGGGPGSKG